MAEGSVTFSFDCEGKWGMTDISTPWDIDLTRTNLLKAYEFILDTLNEYDIPATFAFVGALTETREEFLDSALPVLTSENYSKWLEHSKYRIPNKAEEGWFLPELLSMVKERQTHEIATHGYTHIPFNMLDEIDVKIELQLVQSWADRNNIQCSTLVFPRNIILHQEILKDYGILGYRNLPIELLKNQMPKYIKTLVEEIWIFQNSEHIEKTGVIKIPGGTFINWRHGFRRYIPPTISLLKYKSMINNARLCKGVAHFWLHPHNLITSPPTKNLFKKLCAEVAVQREASSLVIKRQNDYLI